MILDMPLDQFFAACQDPAEMPSAPSGKRWAVPIGGPADLERLWNERQGRRQMINGG